MSKTTEQLAYEYRLHETLAGIANLTTALQYAHQGSNGASKQCAAYGLRHLLETFPALMEAVSDYEDRHVSRQALVRRVKEWADSLT